MMSKTVGISDNGGDGRKHPWNPKLDNKSPLIKKTKKLSKLAERALAALDEHDDGSISSSSDNEKGDSPLTNSQDKKIPHSSSDLSDGCSDKSIEKCGTEQSTINIVTDLTGGEDDEDDEVVVPHHPLSEYGNVLSCFLSTPFDRNEMLSLYLSK